MFNRYYEVNIPTIRENSMKKSTLFISVILTSFVLTVAIGAVTAFGANAEAETPQANTAPVQPVVLENPKATATASAAVGDTQAINLTPEQGAQLAAAYLGRSDLYSVEGQDVNGTIIYRVTFNNGDIAIISSDATIFQFIPAPVQNQASFFNWEKEGDHDD